MKKQSNLSRLMGYAGKHRILTYLSWVLSAVSALLTLVPFWYIWRIIHDILQVSPDYSQAQSVTHYGWMAVLFAVISIVVYITALMCSHLSAFRIASNIRKELMRHIAELPLGVTEKYGSGKLRRIVNDSSKATETYLAHRLPDKAGAVATPVGLLFLLLIFDWRLGLLSLAPVTLGFAVMSKMTGKSMQEKMTQYQNALADMSNEAVEYVRGIPVVKTFGQTVFSFRRFKDSIDHYSEWAVSYTKSMRHPMCLLTMLIHGVFAFILGGGLWLATGSLSNDLILNILFYIIITPVLTVTMTKIMFQSENTMLLEDSMKRIDELLDLEPLPENGKKLPKDSSVSLKNVSYSYDGGEKALNHISLDIASGETVAFVGPSGGGKTTLANIISRFFDADEGQVFIGGVDVKEIPKAKLMETVSFVFQNSRLLKGSILENVRMARPSASEEDVLQALKQAQCIDIIAKFPDGIHTILGTEGIYLSGGEQQRISIARAVLKNAPILILDEATAYADPDNEVRIQEALAALAKDKTVILIAHRLSTVAGADRIFVLKDGKIAESGSLDDLQKQGGIFAEMMMDYASSIQWKVEKEAIK